MVIRCYLCATCLCSTRLSVVIAVAAALFFWHQGSGTCCVCIMSIAFLGCATFARQRFLPTIHPSGAVPCCKALIAAPAVHHPCPPRSGPIDATFKAIDLLVRVPVELTDYSVNSLTEGSQAPVTCKVSVVPLDVHHRKKHEEKKRVFAGVVKYRGRRCQIVASCVVHSQLIQVQTLQPYVLCS